MRLRVKVSVQLTESEIELLNRPIPEGRVFRSGMPGTILALRDMIDERGVLTVTPAMVTDMSWVLDTKTGGWQQRLRPVVRKLVFADFVYVGPKEWENES